MELVLTIASTIISVAALITALRKRVDHKAIALGRLADDAVAYAKACAQDGIPPERIAMQAAIMGDMKDNGKRDFTDRQLLVAVKARLNR